jgi:hypothetical protein
MEINFKVDGKRVAQAVNNAKKRDLTQAQGDMVLELHSAELEERLGDTLRQFVRDKFGA